MVAIPQIADGDKTPRHIAIIMDGNGRWAKARNLPRIAGHERGMEAVRAAIRGAAKEGVDFLTLYAFSSENWSRPREEVIGLMGLLRAYIRREIKTLHKEGIRVRFIGDRDGLPEDIQPMLRDAEALTEKNTGMTVIIALNYGSRQEMTAAFRAVLADIENGRLDTKDVTDDTIRGYLMTSDVPDPDLIIRTSGEMRLSNFMLWQAAYAEFLFLDILWPDFTEETMQEALQVFAGRERRFGGRAG